MHGRSADAISTVDGVYSVRDLVCALVLPIQLDSTMSSNLLS